MEQVRKLIAVIALIVGLGAGVFIVLRITSPEIVPTLPQTDSTTSNQPVASEQNSSPADTAISHDTPSEPTHLGASDEKVLQVTFGLVLRKAKLPVKLTAQQRESLSETFIIYSELKDILDSQHIETVKSDGTTLTVTIAAYRHEGEVFRNLFYEQIKNVLGAELFKSSQITDLLSASFESHFYGFGAFDQTFHISRSPDNDSIFRIRRWGGIPPDPESVQHYLDGKIKGRALQQSTSHSTSLTDLDSGRFQYLKPLILEHLVNH